MDRHAFAAALVDLLTAMRAPRRSWPARRARQIAESARVRHQNGRWALTLDLSGEEDEDEALWVVRTSAPFDAVERAREHFVLLVKSGEVQLPSAPEPSRRPSRVRSADEIEPAAS